MFVAPPPGSDTLTLAFRVLDWLPSGLVIFFATIALLRCLTYPNLIQRLFSSIQTLFSPLLTPRDVLTPEQYERNKKTIDRNKCFLLALAAALLSAGWCAVLGYLAASKISDAVHSAAQACAWAYAAAALGLRPSVTPDYSILTLALSQLAYHGLHLWSLAQPGSHRALLQEPALRMHSAGALLCLVIVVCIMSKPLLSADTSSNIAALDEKHCSDQYTNPEDRVNLYQWVSFSWIWPLLAKGSRMDLKIEDVWQLSPLNWSRHLHDKFKSKTSKSLAWKLLVLNWVDILADGGLQIVTTIMMFAPAFFTKQVLESLALPPPARYGAIKWALLALLFDYVAAQLNAIHTFHANRALQRMRSQILSALHEKTLVRKDMSGVATQQKSRVDDDDKDYSGASTGRIVNMLSGDTGNVINSLTYVSMLLEVPMQFIIALVFLYTLLGWASFAGLVVLAVTIPLNNWITKQNKSIVKRLFKAKDERLNHVNVFIRAIRFIRSHDWQDRWQEKILASREQELKLMMNRRFSAFGLGLLWQLSPPAIIVLSFGAFTLIMKRELTVPIAFVAISLFGNLSGPLTWFPQLILQLLLARTSVQRLEAFLNEPEVPDSASSLKNISRPDADPGQVSIQGTFTWSSRDQQEEEATEPDLPGEGTAENQPAGGFQLTFSEELVFPVGITIVSGSTASGKSSLLQALLGEMPCIEGRGPHLVKDRQNVAYGAQSAWIETGTVKDNILFGTPYDQARYDQVLDACCLRPDMALWDGGDMVEVGERGIALSGGQKARIALAKCLYAYAQVVLLDDPLSAVDSHTAVWLLRHCFQSPLVKDRIIILVTHHLDLVGPAASQILQLESGKLHQLEQQTPKPVDIAEPVDAKEAAAPTEMPSSKLVQEEEMATGSVSWAVYKRYITGMGYGIWILLAVLMVVSRLASFLQNWVVKEWGEAAQSAPVTYVHYGQMDVKMTDFVDSATNAYQSASEPFHTAKTVEGPMRFLLIYTGIVLFNVLIDILTSAVVFLGTLVASRVLFKELLHSVTHTKMRWFDATPAGRILNRFSEDFAKVDGSLSMSFRALLGCFVRIVANLVIVSFLIPWFLIAAVALVFMIFIVSRPYVKTARSLRRIDAVIKSPVYSGFSEVVHGVSTIRAFAAEHRYQERMYHRLDAAGKINYSYFSTNRWLNLRFDLIGAGVRFITYALVIFTDISQGLAAIAIVSCSGLISVWQSLIRMSAQLELDLNAIERIDHYIANEQEPPSIIEGHRPPLSWPSASGGIDIDNFSIRYAEDLPLVLKNLSFSIKAGEKIGLVGRTGSGKSTFGLALLRFLEAETGSITVDGIDISTIGLSDLRRNITVMSQDPVLFSGTIRENLDPFDEHDSNELWDVLHKVGLAREPGSAPSTAKPSRAGSLVNVPAIGAEDSRPGSPSVSSGSATVVAPTTSPTSRKGAIKKLDDLVAESGSNFSAGERQLLALARALLRRPKILLMDEASSSIDKAADARLQTFIKQAFSSSTVITIAHRLLTVCEYDRILVLDAGKLVEYDSPKALLSKGPASPFYQLCVKSTERDEIFGLLGQTVRD